MQIHIRLTVNSKIEHKYIYWDFLKLNQVIADIFTKRTYCANIFSLLFVFLQL